MSQMTRLTSARGSSLPSSCRIYLQSIGRLLWHLHGCLHSYCVLWVMILTMESYTYWIALSGSTPEGWRGNVSSEQNVIYFRLTTDDH